MSVNRSGDHPHEIIIVRHARNDDEGEHHGGVWKIAFADFMTALMCFFLVMWLINAANEETRVSVASYFNPIKLVDRNTSQRGLEEAGAGPQSEDGGVSSDPNTAPGTQSGDAEHSGQGSHSATSAAEAPQQMSDEHLFSDPFAVLAEIAANSGELQNLSAKGDGGAQLSGPATGASGGEQYRDPFAPDFWSNQVEQDEPGVPDLFEAPQTMELRDGTDPRAGLRRPADDIEPDELQAESEKAFSSAESNEASEDEGEGETDPGDAENGKAEEEGEAGSAEVASEPRVSEATIRAAQEVRTQLAEAFGANDRIREGISVTPTDAGLLISLTDQLDYGMFQIGSALPRRDLVLAMEKIGAILNGREGSIKIQGHTDARPYRGGSYDNWRLSTARAHSAYYMLVRAGLKEKRVTEVSGFADRRLKEPTDPMAAVNRRIEILLETGG